MTEPINFHPCVCVSYIIIDIISNYYNDCLWSEGPLRGTFINYNDNIAHSLKVFSRVSLDIL